MEEIESRYSFRVSAKEKEEFNRVADKNSHTPSKLLRNWITDYVDGKKDTNDLNGEIGSSEDVIAYDFRLPLSLREDFKITAKENSANAASLMRVWLREYTKNNS